MVVLSREVQSVLLILLGTAITRISVTDVYLRYVKETIRPFLILTGLLLLVLGILALIDVVRDSREKPAAAEVDEGAEMHDGHGHTHMRIAWLLLLPVLSILLIAPPALGAYSAARDPSTVIQPATTFDPLPPDNPLRLPLSEYAVRAVWGGESSLQGHTFELEGFVTPVPDGKQTTNLPDGQSGNWWLSRMSLSCCAADARATRILAVGAKDLPANTWVRMRARYLPGGPTNSDKAIPWIQVEEIKVIPQPSNPYE